MPPPEGPTLASVHPRAVELSDAPVLPLGTILGDSYELRSVLGGGGMAQVYSAYDSNLHRHVAVKVGRPGTPAVLHTEGSALAAIRHPAVVTVFHMGVHQGLEYLVMELIGGRSLRQWLDAQGTPPPGLPIDAAAPLLASIAEALEVVHAAGLSHRDLKPDNVMLAPGGRIVLTDFGLTKPEFDRQLEDGFSGSPDYMAPEVITGTVHRGGGHLVDLYALGIVAHEVLSGAPPFSRDHWARTLKAHVSEAPPDLRTLRPDVPDRLAELVLSLLEKEPERRPESAESVVWSLRALRDRRSQLPASARPVSG